MSKLAIFTAPKAFSDAHINMIQRNAIRSWQQMGDAVEVYLLGDEEAIAEAAKELGVVHLPKLRRNKEGTPLVSSIFQEARQASNAALMAYVNADILLFPELMEIVKSVHQRTENFVLMGQRYDLDVSAPLDFSEDWRSEIHNSLGLDARLHPAGGSDYFIFPRKLYADLPDFAIGRAGWDNWMIYHAMKEDWLALDATASLTVIHQNHDYSHLPEGQAHYRVGETDENVELAGGMRRIYSLLDLKYELVNGEIRAKRPSLARLVRGLERIVQPDERVASGWRWALLRRLRKLRRSLIESREA
jgi:hypothetical protein